jgi:hypothetical protein
MACNRTWKGAENVAPTVHLAKSSGRLWYNSCVGGELPWGEIVALDDVSLDEVAEQGAYMKKCVCGIAALVLLVSAASGVTMTWVGGKDTNFMDPNNWDPILPVVGNVLTVGAGSPNDPIFNGDTNSSRPNGLNTTAAAHLTIKGGALYSYGNNTLNGEVVQLDGDFNLRANVYVGSSAVGTVTINGGGFSQKNTLYVGYGSGGNGTVNVWGGNLNLGATPQIGTSGGTGKIDLRNDRYIYCPGSVVSTWQGFVTSGKLTTAADHVIIITYNSSANNTAITATKRLAATEPSPSDGAANYPVSKLMWRPGTKSSVSTVYMGTDAAAVAAATPSTLDVYLGTTASDNITLPSPLADSLKYYWRVDSTTPEGSLAGNVWSFTPADVQAARKMEKLGRGVVALNTGSGVYVGWRLLASDPASVGFNLYRNGTKLNTTVITASTNYTDTGATLTQTNYYYVRPVINGRELAPSAAYALAANTPVRQYIPIPMVARPAGYVGTYEVAQGWVGDLDGDGEYEIVVTRGSDSLATYKLLDAYKRDGTFMWRVQLGPNIQAPHVQVYDLDCDGKAEVVAKTSESTTFGDGTTIGDTDGDGITDYREIGAQYEIMSGPEFISVINGMTGAELARTDFISRGTSLDWGDNYGHRQNFIEGAIAYFDGVRPSIVYMRGPGDYMKMCAWDYVGGQLKVRWTWFNNHHAGLPVDQKYADFQQWRIVDIDEDGRDEISLGGAVVDEYGKPLYGTELGHGDRFQITKFDPDRPGMQCYAIQQNNTTMLGAAYYDIRDGTFISKYYGTGTVPFDTGRGDAGDIDPNKGIEFWSTMANTYDCKGNALYAGKPWPSLMIWWDGDLYREILSAADGDGRNPVINKWNYTSKTEGRLISLYSDDGSYSVITPYAARAPFYGDILGDWREEMVLEQSDHTKLRLYTTKIPTSTRIYCLMENPYYRLGVVTKGYLVSPYTDYYLGNDMTTPPAPYRKAAKETGRILREWWTGLTGTSVSSLTSSANYPDKPNGSQFLTSLETTMSMGTNYGDRIRGYLWPRTTGTYNFWIAGDDDCELWLSTDASPAKAVKIAYVSGYTTSRQWTKYPEQASAAVSLVAGRKYYIDVLHKQGANPDCLAVAWQGPGISQQVIDGQYLSPWTGILAGDATIDNKVNWNDVSSAGAGWLDSDCDIALELDTNGDCIIDFLDFAILGRNWMVGGL